MANGKLVGLLTIRQIDPGRMSMFGMMGGNEGAGMLPVILPAADVAEIASQAQRGSKVMATKEYPVTKSDAEWRAQLTQEQYMVLRQHATERPGSCALLVEKRPGTFTCVGCGQPLFVGHAQVRKRHRVAELLRSHRGGHRHDR